MDLRPSPTPDASTAEQPAGQPPFLPSSSSSSAEQPANSPLQTVVPVKAAADSMWQTIELATADLEWWQSLAEEAKIGGDKRMSSEEQHALEKNILEEANRLKTLDAKTSAGPRGEISASSALDRVGKPLKRPRYIHDVAAWQEAQSNRKSIHWQTITDRKSIQRGTSLKQC